MNHRLTLRLRLASRLQPRLGMNDRTCFNRWSRRLRRRAGFSATEAAAIMAAVSVLSLAAAPSVERYLEDARFTRAQHDARAIAMAVVRLASDVSGSSRVPGGWATCDLLVSAGALPALGEGGAREWLAERPPLSGALDDHLVQNAHGYPAWRPGGGFGAGGWRGPYLDARVGADPWGRRFAVNVRWLARGGARDTAVVSAGPNGLIETAFAVDGLCAGGDDIVALVSSGG